MTHGQAALETAETQWWAYVLRCADDSFYVGVTTDLARRLHEHNHTARGARYTRARRPLALIAARPAGDRSEALQAEAAFRKLRRTAKERWVAQWPPPAELDGNLRPGA